MNDRAYLKEEDQARGQGGVKHAYDGVQQWAVELLLLRMGGAKGVCTLPDQVGCDYEDSCEHSIWSRGEV